MKEFGMKVSVSRLIRYGVTAICVAAFAAAGVQTANAQAKTRLTVYTALDNDQLAAFKRAAEADIPDIDISWVREGTGVITARLLAEKDNPRADVIWGLAATSVLLLEERGVIEPYTPKGASILKASFRDAKDPTAWTGMDAYLSVICFNTVEAAKKNIPPPKSWNDLLNPVYKNEIVMPNPGSSGAGYLTVAAWLQLMGEEGGWKYMDGLHNNIAVYTHSGSASCVQAARGERVVGIGFDMRAASEKTRGAPIDILIPSEGAGWELEATAIVRGTKNLEAAKKLVDWSVSRKANELYSKYYAIVSHPDVTNSPPNYPADGQKKMIKNDLRWSALNLQRITQEWMKRYDNKSAPK
jgi:iron(III) transport system substrate-binding protein